MCYTGLPQPVLQLRSNLVSPGCPGICFSDVAVDDAGQLTIGQGLQLQQAEFLARITDKDPTQLSNEQERGVRILFECQDSCEQLPPATLQWAVSIKDSMAIARLQPGTLLRVLAKPDMRFSDEGDPEIVHSQVAFHCLASVEDIEPFRHRRQSQLPSDKAMSAPKRLVDDLLAMTPLSKVASWAPVGRPRALTSSGRRAARRFRPQSAQRLAAVSPAPCKQAQPPCACASVIMSLPSQAAIRHHRECATALCLGRHALPANIAMLAIARPTRGCSIAKHQCRSLEHHALPAGAAAAHVCGGS